MSYLMSEAVEDISSNWPPQDKKSKEELKSHAPYHLTPLDPACWGKYQIVLNQFWFETPKRLFHLSAGDSKKEAQNWTTYLVTKNLICCLTVWPDWAIYWTLGNFSKPVATISLP